MKKRVVLVTSVAEDSCIRDHRIGQVDEAEFQQLRDLAGCCVYDRMKKAYTTHPVLQKVYVYTREVPGAPTCYEDTDQYTEEFVRVEPVDVADHCCHHIIWEWGG